MLLAQKSLLRLAALALITPMVAYTATAGAAAPLAKCNMSQSISGGELYFDVDETTDEPSKATISFIMTVPQKDKAGNEFTIELNQFFMAHPKHLILPALLITQLFHSAFKMRPKLQNLRCCI
jgi:hypothetical protein